MKKKLLTVLIIGIMIISLIACGNANTTDTPTAGTEIAKETEAAVSETPEVASETETDVSETPEATTETETATLDTETSDTQEADAVTYEDNFSVDQEAVVAFAQRIKEAVANQDIEALADLTSYPLYIGFTDGAEMPQSRDEFISLGAEKIFTPEMMDSIANADENSLSPSMAGFALSAEGRPNMVFGVVDGKLAIQGMNY